MIIMSFYRKLGCAVLFFALVPILCSCASMNSEKKSIEGLLTAANDFNAAFRWEDFKTASTLVAPSYFARFWSEADQFPRRIRIMDFQLRSHTVNAQTATGETILQVNYFYTNSPTVRAKTITQKWVYIEKEKRWEVIDSGFKALIPE